MNQSGRSRRTFLEGLLSAAGSSLFWPKILRAAGLYNVGAFWRTANPARTLWGWANDNFVGVLGPNSPSNQGVNFSPVQIPGIWSSVQGCTYPHGLDSLGVTLGIRSDSTLWAWGNAGCLGPNASAYYLATMSPVQIAGTWSSASIQFGGTAALGIQSDGSLWVWGDNSYGECGQGSTTVANYSSPVQVGTAWAQAVMGNGCWLGIKTNGTLWSCGLNAYGELGIGNRKSQSSPVQIGTGTSWTQVASGVPSTGTDSLSYAIRADGTLWGWGNNNDGALGQSDTKSRSSPVQISGSWTQVASSNTGGSAYGIQTNGSLWAWGGNASGQLGISNLTSYSSPVQIGTSTLWSRVVAGNQYVLAQQTNGTTWGWGAAYQGQLGDQSFIDQSSPVQAMGSWTQVAAGNFTSFGIKSNGTLWGFGDNSWYEINSSGGWPYGASTNCYSPLQVTGSWLQVTTAGNSYNGSSVSYALGIQTNGTLWGWGDNSYGQLAQPVLFQQNFSPLQIAGSWTQMSAGGSWNLPYSLGIRTDGTLWAWGCNSNGQLGQSNQTSINSPLQISGSWTLINGGPTQWLGIQTNGTLWACGDGGRGELGQSNIISHSSPVQIGGSWLQVSNAADDNDCSSFGIRADGTLWGWGSNDYGQLGQSNRTAYSSPVQISGSWTQVSGSAYGHILGIQLNGTLWAWGYNNYGELGVGNTTFYSSPVQVGTGYWQAVSAGLGFSYGITVQDVYYAWGLKGWGGSWPYAIDYAPAVSSPVQLSGAWLGVYAFGEGGFGISM